MKIDFLMKENFSEEDFLKGVNLHVRGFNVKEDSNQIQEEDVSYKKIIDYDCEQECIIKENEKVIGSFYFILTSKKIMDNFLEEKINERDLLNNSRKLINFNSIYFCSAIIEEDYRRKGLIFKATKKLIKHINPLFKEKPSIFGWTFSESGSNLFKKTAKEFSFEFFEKKR